MPEANGFVEMKVLESLALHKHSYNPCLSSKDYLIRKETVSLGRLFQGSVNNYLNSQEKLFLVKARFFLTQTL